MNFVLLTCMLPIVISQGIDRQVYRDKNAPMRKQMASEFS